MNEVKDRLVRWLEKNPDSWLRQSYTSIAKAADVSTTSVDRYLPELVADRDGIMPSQVLQQREEAGVSHRGRSKANQDLIRKVIEENPGAHLRDLAYLAKCAPRVVKRVLEEMKPELEESQNMGNEGEIRDIDAEIAQLQARRNALSKK